MKEKTTGANLIIDNNNPGFRKRLETNKVIRLFLKLLKWGRMRGIRYYYSLTAVEYIGELAAEYPALKDLLYYAVSIFEEAVFSRHLIDAQVIRKYKQAIKTIVKTR
ncbi:MAG: DUF4129 domain-containing protein [Spirochaetales bacterium]|nr:DUF4129 domain-containing protein [Spirochaetales bacterium]